MPDKFIKCCLVAIVGLLAVIAMRPFVTTYEAHAARKRQYAVARFNDLNVEEVLKKYSSDGWELVAAPFGVPSQGASGVGLLIFQK